MRFLAFIFTLRACAAALVFGLLVAVNVTSVRAADGDDDPAFLTVSGGLYDLNDEDKAAELNIRYQHDKKFWIFKPHFGLLATSDAAVYGYGGVLIDIYFGNRWVVTGSTAAGLYSNGHGKDLGSAVEFRSGLDIAYRFDDRSRLGVGFYHISNTGFWSDHNPGEETLLLTYSVPMTKIWGAIK